MSKMMLYYNNRTILQKTLFVSVFLFSFSWLITFLSIRLIWGGNLKSLNPLIYAADFLLPLLFLISLILIVSQHDHRLKIILVLFFVLFIIAVVNILVVDLHLMNYGDKGTLSGMIAHKEVFPRWLLGTGLLEIIRFYIIGLFMGNPNELNLVRFLSALVMCTSSVLLAVKHANKMAILLTITAPIWLLFSSGYDEYYPFIAPVFVLFMLLLSTHWIQKMNPLIFGLICASIGLLYAGFLPLSVILLVFYATQRGIKQAIFACASTLGWALLLVLACYGNKIAELPNDFLQTLHLNETAFGDNSVSLMTPFYNLKQSFAIENLQRLFLQFFWSGSFPFFFIMLGCLGLFFKRIMQNKTRATLLALAALLIFQIIYFFVMIPKLGVVSDIDLFFTVYLTFAFFAGWLLDQLIETMAEKYQGMVKMAGFSFCLGSSSVVSIYLIVLGLYALT